MKIIKFIASFLLILGILALMVWAGIRANDQTCTGISILIHAPKNPELLTKSDVSDILQQHHTEWEGKKIKEIDPAEIRKILAKENYIKSVNKVHFSGSKLQIEVTLYDILLEVHTKDGEKFLLDVNGAYLPYSPKTGNDVITVAGAIPYAFRKKEAIASGSNELYQLFTVASLIKEDPFYADLFHKISINDKQEIVLHPSHGNLPVVFGTVQDAENKLKTLRYMYDEVLPYMNENKYAQLDVRFKNRIVAKKNKS
ncbi:MAG: hypothetical protein FWD09_01350 [Lentimicrobiaceae bacterium]|nr:hypothetical protein [Lentimicrobiaceae bacterium]